MITKVVVIHKGTGDRREYDDVERVEYPSPGLILLWDGQMERILNLDGIAEIQVYKRLEDAQVERKV